GVDVEVVVLAEVVGGGSLARQDRRTVGSIRAVVAVLAGLTLGATEIANQCPGAVVLFVQIAAVRVDVDVAVVAQRGFGSAAPRVGARARGSRVEVRHHGPGAVRLLAAEARLRIDVEVAILAEIVVRNSRARQDRRAVRAVGPIRAVSPICAVRAVGPIGPISPIRAVRAVRARGSLAAIESCLAVAPPAGGDRESQYQAQLLHSSPPTLVLRVQNANNSRLRRESHSFPVKLERLAGPGGWCQ